MTATIQDWRERSTLTVEETAPILGIGRSTAYVLARTGELPTLKLGRRFVVPVAQLRRMLGEVRNDHELAGGELVERMGNGAAQQTG